MQARYANVKNFNRVVKTYKWMLDKFGKGEFTSKEFKDAKHNYKRGTFSSLQFLIDEGIVKVVRTEKMTKEVEIPDWKSEVWLVDKNGNHLMPSYDWTNLPEVAKKAMLAMNGQDFHFDRKDTETVESEKYYYAVNPDCMLQWRKNYSRLLVERADKILGKIAELTEQKDKLMACQF